MPVSEHVSRSLGFDGFYSILSVLHAHFCNLPVKFTFITDSLCTSKLFREGIQTTVKLASNTRMQREHAEQFSLSFPLSKVKLIWVPSALNLGDIMTKVSKDPIKLVNSQKYRSGQLRPDMCYLDLHDKMQANCFFKCIKGQSVYTDLDFSNLITCGWEDKSRAASQTKARYFKELSESYQHEQFLPNEQASLACVLCTGTLSECSDLQDEACGIYSDMVQQWIDT